MGWLDPRFAGSFRLSDLAVVDLRAASFLVMHVTVTWSAWLSVAASAPVYRPTAQFDTHDHCDVASHRGRPPQPASVSDRVTSASLTAPLTECAGSRSLETMLLARLVRRKPSDSRTAGSRSQAASSLSKIAPQVRENGYRRQ
jgi:hypothetical protein